ncbi:MAG: TerB family tellurite resistance protein [Cytophagales bacterium]|nr:TerB family tellurite resistance protein [Cytophagales bacterium]
MNAKTSRQPLLDEPDLCMGLGSLAYAVAKSDGHLQPSEVKTIQRIFEESADPLALRSFLIQDYYGATVEESYSFAMRRFASSRDALSDATKKRMVSMIERLARVYDDVSRKERDLIKRFRRDLNKL